MVLLARKFALRDQEDEGKWAMEICGTPAIHIRYKRLRSQLKRILLGDLFHLKIQGRSELGKAMYLSYRDLFMIRILLLLGARGVAMWLVPKALKRARKFELTSDRVDLLAVLKRNASFEGARSKFAQYASEHAEALTLRSAEERLSGMNEEVNVELAVRARPSARARALARSGTAEAKALFKEFPTFNVGLNYFRLATLHSEIEGDFQRTASLCAKAEAFLVRFEHLESPVHGGQFALKRMTSAIAASEFAVAEEAAKICERAYPPGENNWFISKESEFFLLMHTGKFPVASTLLSAVRNQERFASQPVQVREKWVLFGHYAAFVSGNLLKPGRGKKAFEKIVREVPVYTRDKAGYNASLLILQHLILASRGDMEGLIEKSEALKRYIFRHLLQRRDSQLYAFLRTLYLLQEHGFNVAKVKYRARRYIERFEQTGLEKVDETQVLPYRQMWEWIGVWIEQHQENLAKNKHRKRKSSFQVTA